MPQKWNVYSNVPYTHKNEEKEAFESADKHEGIIHYAGQPKPWLCVRNCRYGYIWWRYAKKVPFYTDILERLVNFKIYDEPNCVKSSKVIKLFSVFPIIKRYDKNNKRIYYLFKFIPFIKCTKKANSIYYKLFGIPVLKISVK